MRNLTIHLMLAAACLAAPPARAQHTGPFQPMTTWYVGPLTGSVGTSPYYPTDNDITFDTNGNGLFDPPNDLAYPMPSVHGVGTGTWNFRLSPSRRHLYVFGVPGVNPNCAGGTRVYVYRIPATAGAALVPLGASQCLPTGIAFERFFDPDGASQSILCIVGNPDPSTSLTQAVHWLDLNTGTWATSFPELSRIVTDVSASPSGMAAFLQHDASDGDNLADYTGACLMDGHLGEVFNVGGAPLSQLGPPVATAAVVDVSGTLTMRVYWPNASTVRANIPLTDCAPSPPPPPVTGACCLPNGGCAPGLTGAECSLLGGTWGGANTVCESAGCPPPPSPILAVTLTGPASVQRPNSITWTLGWSNTGTLAAGNVSVVDVLPTNVTFVSATGGADYDAFTREVRVSLATLGAGASGSVTITALSACTGLASVTNATFSIREGTQAPIAGSPPVVTALTSPPTNPVTVTSASTALAAEPLGDGAQVEHTITVQEAAGVARDEIRVAFSPGQESTLGAVVDSAGGTVRPGVGAQFVWALPLPANASRTLRFRTLVSECRTGDVATTTLNNGGFLLATNICGGFLGLAAPVGTFALAGPSVSVELFPLAGTQPSGFTRNRAAPVRPGGTLDFEVRIRNATTGLKVVESVTLPVPFTFTCADPPYNGSPPPGTTWDAPTQTLGWSGALGANQLVSIPMRVTLGPDGGGQQLTVQLRQPGCFTGASGKLFAVAVSQPPGAAHVLQLNSRGGVRAVVSVAGAIPQPIIDCPANLVSFSGGLARLPDGDLWIAGQPTLRVNPATLAFENLGDLLLKLDLDSVNDVAWDPVDSSLIFCGYKLTNRLGVRRWKRSTDVVTALYTATPGSGWTGARHVVVGSDRAVACETSVGVLRLPFGGSPVTFDQPAIVDDPVGLAIDADGNYLVVDGTPSPGPKRLAKVDRATGAFTVIADTDSLLESGLFWTALAVAPDAGVSLGSDQGSLALLHRPSLAGEPIAASSPPLQFVDLVQVGSAGSTDVPPPGGTIGTLALAAPSPNPARSGSVFRFALPAGAPVRLALHDVAGRECVRLAEGWWEAGDHDVRWDGRDRTGRVLAPGLYFVRLEVPAGARVRKLVVAR